MRPAVVVALIFLALPATAGAAVRSELDRPAGIRLTLDGRVLTAEIVHTPHFHRSPTTEEQLYGQRILAACGTTFRPVRRGVVFTRRFWPAGARSLTFGFRKDISRRVRWCGVEGDDGGDASFISFVDPELARLVAKGRGPSGDWWRLSAWRGEQLDPCVGFRSGAQPQFGHQPCFERFAEREATLAVQHEKLGDRYVYGAVGRSATAVRVRLADGTVQLAELYPRPRGSRARAAFFMLVLPEDGPVVAGVRAVDADGNTVGRRRFEGVRPLEGG